MILRAALISLFAVCLLCFPAMASQPAGLAAKFVTNPAASIGGGDDGLPQVTCAATFQWDEFFDPRVLDAADTVTLEMAIIPLRSGGTQVTLHESARGWTFAHLRFSSGGFVKGLPYDRSAWNDVTVQLRPATQDYVITVNGASAGPFAYEEFCPQQGGCSTLQGFVLSGVGEEGEAAWIDTISIVRESAAGREVIREIDFTLPCGSRFVTSGGLLISEPPHRARSRR